MRLPLLASAMLLLTGCAAHQSTVAPARKCRDLKVWYHSDNQDFFNGSLPSNTWVGCYKVDQYFEAFTNRTKKGRFVIVFNTMYDYHNKDTDQRTLIHEECHIATWGAEEHGTDWWNCFDRVTRAKKYQSLYATKGEKK